jgi:hypothetical protein
MAFLPLKQSSPTCGISPEGGREHADLKGDQVRRLKALEAENARLRRAVSDLKRDNLIMAAAAKGKF